MTEAEKTEIINAVISALNDDSTNYDDKVVEPYADDIVLIMRKEGDARVGRCVTWEGIIETLTAAAKTFADTAGQSASSAEEAKQAAVTAREAIELAKADIDNKHESVIQAALSASNSAESAALSASSAVNTNEQSINADAIQNLVLIFPSIHFQRIFIHLHKNSLADFHFFLADSFH